MSIFNKLNKADKALYNESSENFIPIACHYSEDTLLTKNGELIQVIQINGINSERISDKLLNLREMVSSSIRDNIDSSYFALWLHTVRRKTNLDDLTTYVKVLPANIHDLWKRKNYWDDKFVNTLYISIVYKSPEIKLKNLASVVNSLFFDVIRKFHEQYFEIAFQKLSHVVDNIVKDLSEYGAVKLGLEIEGDEVFSDPMFLYHRITHLKDDRQILPMADLSSFLASHKYAVGSDSIEVIDNKGKKFASILSIKEYQSISSESLDVFLQLPIELIATEIFFFISKEDIQPTFKFQDYILGISSDKDLKEIKGLPKIMNATSPDKDFCNQQISLTIIGENVNQLERDTASASKSLSKMGIVHVREDINLEQTFWAALPGNFNFLRRMSPTIVSDTAALASLHNFPTGEKYNPWGKAATILRTAKGTPYFMNLHSKNGQNSTCIFGASNTGKTVLMNFLVSEATKFNPSILYLSESDDAKIFIEAIEGSYIDNPKELSKILNPFALEDSKDSRFLITEFLKILCNHYITSLTETELNFLESMLDGILNLPQEERELKYILKKLKFTAEGGKSIKAKLVAITEHPLYEGLFSLAPTQKFSSGGVFGINLQSFTDREASKESLVFEEKKTKSASKKKPESDHSEEAIPDLHKAIRAALIYSLINKFITIDDKPKIIAIDNLNKLLNTNEFGGLMSMLFKLPMKHNAVIISNFNLEDAQKSLNTEKWQDWLNHIGCKIILPIDSKSTAIYQPLKLASNELKALEQMTVISRMFIVQDTEKSIVAELSIGAMTGIVRLLSSKKEELAIYKKILEENPGHPENWVNLLYQALENAG